MKYLTKAISFLVLLALALNICKAEQTIIADGYKHIYGEYYWNNSKLISEKTNLCQLGANVVADVLYLYKKRKDRKECLSYIDNHPRLPQSQKQIMEGLVLTIYSDSTNVNQVSTQYYLQCMSSLF